jgi:AraC-like DNA-binding protein
MSSHPLTYTEHPVDGPVGDLVLCGWEFVAESDLPGVYAHYLVPDGCVSLLYNANSQRHSAFLIFTGPRAREHRVDIRAGDHYCGIRFWPDSGGLILGVSALELFERSEPFANLAPNLSGPVEEQLLNCQQAHDAISIFCRFVAQRRDQCPVVDPIVRRCLQAIQATDGNCSISEIADQLEIGPRQLQRRFRTRVGITPKEYCRIRRIRHALSNVVQPKPKGWSIVAAESGFADQSHLTREAIDLTGISPSRFEDRVQPIHYRNIKP